MVVRGAFVKVQIASITRAKKQHFAELHHVVGVTGFRSFDVFHHRGEIVVIVEVFTHTVAPHTHAAMLTHGIPEERRCFFPGGVIVQLCDTQGTNDFWNLCVGVQTGQLILTCN